MTIPAENTARVGKIPAKQARSLRTVERIETAARELLQEHSWQTLTMASLAKAAGAHVGSIYARFESKEALLDHLDEVYCREVIDLNCALLPKMEEMGFEDALATFIDGIARYHRKNSGLVRTLILETRIGDHPSFHARSKRMNGTLQDVYKLLSNTGKHEGRSMPPEKIAWVFFLILSTVREAVLFPKGLPRPTTSLQKQIQEITAMALAYLNA